MSTHAHSKHKHAHGHGGHGHGEAAHGSLREYLTGFILSVVFTVIPFWLVMGNVLENSTATALSIMVLAAVQMVVHMVYFLHMNTKSEGGWSFLALVFTLILVVITLAGSLWVMYHLNTHMMPEHNVNQLP